MTTKEHDMKKMRRSEGQETGEKYQLSSKGVVLTENPEEVVVPFLQPTDPKTEEMSLMENLEAHLNNLHAQLKNFQAQVLFFNASASAIEAKLDTLEPPPPPPAQT
ncbi:hypothetical protein IHE45_18G005000 [Dioscorea alata]|uniref:Uncharacterized protein n=2 Tax=Dioscorea alata TaxID=55571 RepID=A0ACB7U4X4_DIOAL|nr:hypothetical protein IHE45_18G005000 [Dioscorea alata]KAH7655357.1 hypothetical protein IHE45_18G005000 [Dioscorea alata]